MKRDVVFFSFCGLNGLFPSVWDKACLITNGCFYTVCRLCVARVCTASNLCLYLQWECRGNTAINSIWPVSQTAVMKRYSMRLKAARQSRRYYILSFFSHCAPDVDISG